MVNRKRKNKKILTKMQGIRVPGDSNIQKAKIRQIICDSGTQEVLLCILMIGSKVANGISPTTMEDCCQIDLSDRCIQWRNKECFLTAPVKIKLEWGSQLFWKGLRHRRQNHDETVDVTWPQWADLLLLTSRAAAHKPCCCSLKGDIKTKEAQHLSSQHSCTS